MPQELTGVLTTLRAVILYKDAEHTKIRPIGIGESLRRTICRCVAKQERELWSLFFTSALPEDEESRRFLEGEALEESEEARLALEGAQQAAAETDATNLGGGAARPDGGATRAGGGVRQRLAALQRDKDAADERLAARRIPLSFPRNYFCSANGCDMVVHNVQSWIDKAPQNSVLSDDKVNMYNAVEQLATVRAMREREEFQGYIPLFRTLYAEPARIFLVRIEGELSFPTLRAGEGLDEHDRSEDMVGGRDGDGDGNSDVGDGDGNNDVDGE
jgi:hypothetical protein